MKKIGLVLMIGVCQLLAYQDVKAQVSLGAELAFPTGDFGSTAGTGIGGFFAVDDIIQHKRIKRLSSGILIGYIHTGAVTTKTGGYTFSSSTSLIPLLYSAKLFFKEKGTGVYALLDFGEYFSISSVTSNAPGASSESGAGNAAGIGFGLGVKGKKVDASFRYNIGDFSLVGIRLAYVFPKKEKASK